MPRVQLIFLFALVFVAVIGMASAADPPSEGGDSEAPSSEAAAGPDGAASGSEASAGPDGAASGSEAAEGPGGASAGSCLEVPAVAGVAAAVVAGYVL